MMKTTKWINLGISVALIGLGVAAIISNLFFEINMAFTWPLAMMLVGSAMILYAGVLSQKVPWMAYLYIFGAVALVMGGIFLLNVLTKDWNAWAYAWILILPASGWGVLMMNRHDRWPEMINMISRITILAGLLFFIAFGALTGGLFIQFSAPLILIIGGVLLYRANEKGALLERFAAQFSRNKREAPALAVNHSHGTQLAESLTEREMQVLQLIDQGLSNAEIADRLTLAPSTVKTHINNLYGKLGVRSRVRAIRQARTLGLIQASGTREF
jgi:DNA-binding CsgD family transcriptional regulator